MQDFWVDFAITTIISVLKVSVKNKATKLRIKAAMLKIRDMISVLYPDEEVDEAKARKSLKG